MSAVIPDDVWDREVGGPLSRSQDEENSIFSTLLDEFSVSFHEISPLSNVALSPVHPTGSKPLFKKYCSCVHRGKI